MDSSKLTFRWEWMSAPVQAGGASAKTKSSSSSAAVKIKEEWKAYDAKVQALLDKAVQNKSPSVEFEAGGVKFEVDLDKMVQRNLKTKYEREVRMYIESEDEEEEDDDEEAGEDKTKDGDDGSGRWFCWQWQEEYTSRWISYSPHTSIELERAYRQYKHKCASTSGASSQDHLFKLNVAKTNASYTIDLKRMSQKNDKSGYSRKVRREMSEITNEESGAAAAEESTGPMTRLKRRATLTSADKKASTASTISISSTEDAAVEARPKAKLARKTSKAAAAATADVKEEAKDVKAEDEEEEMPEAKSGVKRKLSKAASESKPAKAVKAEPVAEEDEEENDENAPTTSKKSKPTAKKSGAKSRGRKRAASDDEDEEAVEVKEEEKIVTLKFAGNVPVDSSFLESSSGPNNYKIYSEGGVYYDCMLNQTNVQYNNNKFYIIQLVEQANPKKYVVWMRWGRVGKHGQTSAEHCGTDINKAKSIFCKKFADKTRNEWADKDSFEKYPGKYDLVIKDYNANDDEETKAKEVKAEVKEEKVDVPPSKLDKKVQELIELVCNVTEMENLLKEMKFDAKKAPLGKLSKGQIKAGYAALKEIEDHINNKTTSGSAFIQANNDFYTRIPHDFGMRVPPLIRTPHDLREKLKLLEVLEEIDVAVKMLNQKSDIVNPVDRHYDQLECELKPLDHDDKMFKLIKDYLAKNHAATHCNYKLKLLDVFEARKEREAEAFKDVGNRMLLWHGSRLTNWAGILSQGLRIAPPEAPVTGYMFGKGCYFSDSSSKSANYCYTSSNKSIGILSLSEVSLGTCNELKVADYNADKLPPGKTSTKGVGRSEPDKSEWVTLEDGCVVPVGKLKSVVKPAEASSYALLYNEYIVYDVSQIKMKYLVKVEFVYDDED